VSRVVGQVVFFERHIALLEKGILEPCASERKVFSTGTCFAQQLCKICCERRKV
jgi:hypothetical protein